MRLVTWLANTANSNKSPIDPGYAGTCGIGYHSSPEAWTVDGGVEPRVHCGLLYGYLFRRHLIFLIFVFWVPLTMIFLLLSFWCCAASVSSLVWSHTCHSGIFSHFSDIFQLFIHIFLAFPLCFCWSCDSMLHDLFSSDILSLSRWHDLLISSINISLFGNPFLISSYSLI